MTKQPLHIYWRSLSTQVNLPCLVDKQLLREALQQCHPSSRPGVTMLLYAGTCTFSIKSMHVVWWQMLGETVASPIHAVYDPITVSLKRGELQGGLWNHLYMVTVGSLLATTAPSGSARQEKALCAHRGECRKSLAAFDTPYLGGP